MRELAELAERLATVERRLANLHRVGVVSHVDPARQLCRLRIGGTDEAPFLSPWTPYAQVAGAMKVHSPPSVGQQMRLDSPAGDLRQGVASPFTWSDAEPSPSDAGDEHVLTFGELRIEVTIEGLRLTFRDAELTVNGEGILLKGATIVTDGETRLNNGGRAVAYVGAADSRGDTISEGASGVFV